MSKRLLTGIAFVFGSVVTVTNPLMSVALAVVAWIYVARMASKVEGTLLSHEMKTKIKTLLAVAAVSFALFLVGTIVHNVFSGLGETEEALFLLISLFAAWVAVVSTAGALVLLLKERGKAE